MHSIARRKLTLTNIRNPNRSISFVDVNGTGRSFYVVDWRTVVVEGGNVIDHVKREGELYGRRKCPGEHVWGKCPDH